MNRTRSKDARRQERLNTELLLSILQSNMDHVISLLQEGANPNARCRTSCASALHIAALRGHTDIIRELINAKANIQVRDRNGCCPIHLAAWAGYVTVLKVILNHDSSLVNSVVKYEEIPVVLDELDSWDHNHAEITELLLTIRPGSSPLHIASSWNRKQTTEYLLSANADVNLKDCRGLTPLDVAGFKTGGYYNFIDHNKNGTESLADQNSVSQKMYPPSFTKNLDIQKMPSGQSSAAVSSKHSFGVNPEVACLSRTHSQISLIENAEENDSSEAEYHSTVESSTAYDLVKMLVEFGAKVKDECVENGNENEPCFRTNQTTTLHTAVLNNDLKLIDWLLEECQCDHMLMTINDEGDTPLHMAVKRRYFEALRNMISWLDLDTLNKTDKYGMTALYLSVDLEWLKGVSILLEAGADIKIKNYKHETVINLAIRKNNPKLLEEILSAEEEPDLLEEFLKEPMITAIENLNLTCLRLLVDYGANVNENLDDLGHNSLHKAVLEQWIDGVELLLNFSADVTLKNLRKETIFHMAAKKGNSKLLRILLNHKDSFQVLNDVDDDGLTPLFLAVESGCVECVRLLISLNVDATIKLTDNANILHFAVKYFPNTKEEIIQAKTLPKYYFQDIESWLKMFMLLTGATVVLLSSELSGSRHLASLSVLNSSIVMLFLFARFSKWGLHVLMFEKVSYNVFEVLSRFIPLFIGFLFAFMIHFQGDPPFGNFWESLCKVLIMLVELDYAGAFGEDTVVNIHTIFGRLLFVTFALLVVMVMVNLIVGMSVSDIAELEMQGRSQRLKKHTSFLISLELIVYSHWIVKCIPRNLQHHIHAYRKIHTTEIVQPGNPRCPFSAQCKQALLRHGCDDNLQTIEKCLGQIENLTNEVEELKNFVKSRNI